MSSDSNRFCWTVSRGVISCHTTSIRGILRQTRQTSPSGRYRTLPSDWAAAYAELLGRLPRLVRGARLTLCGLSVCVDAVVDLATAEALLRAESETPAAALAAELKRR